jgi:hypothetical protein
MFPPTSKGRENQMKDTRKGRGAKAAPRKPAKDYPHMAGLVIDILNAHDVPQLIKDAIDDALVEAQNQTQIEILIPGGYDSKQLALLLRRCAELGLRQHSGYFSTNASRERTGTDKPRGLSADEIGAHLSAVLFNPTTPARIFNALADELCDMSSYMEYHTPDMIARTIAAYEQSEAKRLVPPPQ